MNVTYTVSADKKTITLKWAAVAGAVGFVYYIDGVRTANTWDGSRTSASFAIKPGTHVYEVVPVTKAISGKVTYPPAPAPAAESPDKTRVPPATKIVDAAGHVWAIAATGSVKGDGAVAVDGVVQTGTYAVTELAYVSKKIYHRGSGTWFYTTGPGVPWTQTTDPFAPAKTFSVTVTGQPIVGHQLKAAVVTV